MSGETLDKMTGYPVSPASREKEEAVRLAREIMRGQVGGQGVSGESARVLARQLLRALGLSEAG